MTDYKKLNSIITQSDGRSMADYKNVTTEYECNGQIWRIDLDVDRFNNYSSRNLSRLSNDGKWENITRLDHKVVYDNFDDSFKELIDLMVKFSKSTPQYFEVKNE